MSFSSAIYLFIAAAAKNLTIIFDWPRLDFGGHELGDRRVVVYPIAIIRFAAVCWQTAAGRVRVSWAAPRSAAQFWWCAEHLLGQGIS
jgi:hypothetical protein